MSAGICHQAAEVSEGRPSQQSLRNYEPSIWSGSG